MEFYFNNNKMEYNNGFSSLDNQLMVNLPEENNYNDIQNLNYFPRDSFVDHTNNNNTNNINQKAPFQHQHFPVNDDSSSDEYESGYSESFKKTMSFYQQEQDENLNQLNQNKNINKNISNINNINIYNNHNNNYYQNQSYNNNNYIKPNPNKNNNYKNNKNIQSPWPIPQDSEILEEEEDGGEDKGDKPEEPEEEYEENFTNQNKDKFNDKTQSDLINNESETTMPSIMPSYDEKKLKKLLSRCFKKGIPPSDDDFSPNSWQVFYPPNDKFFLWDKGKVIPNQVLIKNENDPDNIEIYQGEINSQKEKHGQGRLTTPNYIRVGTWRDDEFTGWGRESRINGDVFEGRFVDGAIYGKGINKSKKDNMYVGEFVDSKREGKGQLTTQKIHYVGEFKYDKFNGEGKIEFSKLGHKYEGEFKNNEINGMGIFTWNNGETYEGEMTNGKMNGYGKYTYTTGQIYEGNYVNGVKEGLGKLISTNNHIYEGEFKNGKPFGEGTLLINGKKFKVICKDGKIEKKK